MRVSIDLFRAADGRLEGVVHAPGTGAAAFAGVLDLLRVLEGIDLCRPPAVGDQGSGPDPIEKEDGDV
jgi:hypothetical protein